MKNFLKMNKLIQRLQSDDRQLMADAGMLFRGKIEWAIVSVIVLMGFVVRFILLFRPMDYDESFTFLAYATKSFYIIISDYSFPNNHVFHSVLVHLSYLMFGDNPWAIRLPAFLAGLLMIPVAYILSRRLFNRPVGWISAGLVALWPELIQYSTNARGYTLVALITLLIFCLAIYLKGHSNFAGWIFLALLSALGFFTIPIMLYPFGAVFGWLFFSGIFGDIGLSYNLKSFLKYLFAAGIGTIIVSILLYSSIIIHYGFDSLIGNRFVISYDMETFIAALPAWLGRFSNSWFNVFPVLAYGVLPGVLISLVNPTRLFRQKISPLLVAMFWLFVVLSIQRPEISSRIFLPFLPLLLMFAVAGWVGFFMRIFPVPLQIPVIYGFAIIILGLLALQGEQIAASNWGYLIGEKGETEQAVLFVKNKLRTDDIVVTSLADVWYYMYKNGIPKSQDENLQYLAYKRAWVLLYVPYGETVESVSSAIGPVANPIDSKHASLQIKYDRLRIYLGLPKSP